MSIANQKQLQHLAMIMDGNRRWAKKNAMDLFLGHSKGGVDAAKRAIAFCIEKNIPYLSLYAFSQENLRRSTDEKNFLFSLIVQQAEQFIDECKKYEMKVLFVGDRTLFPEQTRASIALIEEKTKQYARLQIAVLFCYGGRQEIVAATKEIAKRVVAGEIAIDKINESLFERYLWSYPFPAPDLIVRTGKVKRLSNFLLYQSAYSELCFLDILWPELTSKHLQEMYDAFMETKRNFGV